MKQRHLAGSLILIAVCAASTLAIASDWQAGESSKVEFSFTQQGTKYTGRFSDFIANISIDPANVEAGSISGVVQTHSVNTRDYDRDASLVDVDWFDSDNYPEATYESSSISVGDDGGYVAEGTLTLKGTSRPAEMPFTFEVADDGAAVFDGSLRINRFTYKIGDGWNDTSWIGQYVDVNIELELNQ